MKMSLGATYSLELHEEALAADVDVERIERLHLVELLGGQVALAKRRHPEVDDDVLTRVPQNRQSKVLMRTRP